MSPALKAVIGSPEMSTCSSSGSTDRIVPASFLNEGDLVKSGIGCTLANTLAPAVKGRLRLLGI